MVFARFCKNVIKTSNRSYFGAYYQNCVSCETFIDFQYPWNELLFFPFCWRNSVASDHQSLSNTSFSTHPCKLFSVDSSWPATWTLTSPPHPNPVTWRQLCMWRKLTWTLTSPPHPNPVTWRQLCMWRKLTWTLTSPPHPNPVTWRQLCMHQFQEQLASDQHKMPKTQGSLMAP